MRQIKNVFHLFSALLANLFYGFPSRQIKVIGVTGTDGKTTTTHMIGYLLKEAGLKVAVISSIGAYFGSQEIDTGFHVTTPSSWMLQKLLREIKKRNIEYLVLETTSHGLDQHRLFGINFKIGVLTNITHEHLDYHKNLINYIRTKAKLFQKAKIAVLNVEDNSFLRIKNFIPKKTQIVTYGIKKGDFNLRKMPLSISLLGEHNLYNSLAAATAVNLLGIEKELIQKSIKNFKALKGRIEEIKEGQSFQVFVDIAHTPNAFENVLKVLRKKTSGKLIAVFGCAGLRDREKRPKMGEIAGRMADLVILTAEDPRTEDLNKIIDQIAKGCKKAGKTEHKNYWRIGDREEAIKFAFSKAKKGDLVVLLGKGHERSMCYGTKEFPWSDQEVARKALGEIEKS